MFWGFSLLPPTVFSSGEGHTNHIQPLFKESSMIQRHCLLLKPKGRSTMFRNLDSDSGTIIKIIYYILLPVHSVKTRRRCYQQNIHIPTLTLTTTSLPYRILNCILQQLASPPT